jgi:hypothetical protein
MCNNERLDECESESKQLKVDKIILSTRGDTDTTISEGMAEIRVQQTFL